MSSDTNNGDSASSAENGPQQPVEPIAAVAAPQTVVMAPRRSALGIIAWFGLFFCISVIMVQAVIILAQWFAYQDYFDTSGGLQEKHYMLSEHGRHKIAVINVSGIIMNGEGFVKRQIDRVRDDKNVKAVVLRIDSPGGTVTGSDYILHHLRKLRKHKEEANGDPFPLVVSMGGMAASGGYYIAMAVDDQTDSIFAEPTTTTGSIGVIIPHYDISGLLAKFDIKNDSVVNDAGQYKQLLSMTRSMDPDEEGIDKQEAEARRKRREILQVYVNESFDRFLDIVESGRPNMSEKEVTDAATGQIFTAQQAQERGLVDKIGFIEEAVDRAIELADLEDDKENVRVVRYQRPPTIMDLAGMESQPPGGMDLSALLDMTTPKAYYLATWLPGVVEND